MRADISISGDLYRRLHEAAAAAGVRMVQIIEASLKDSWTTDGLTMRSRRTAIDVPADLIDALQREAARMNALDGHKVTCRSLLEQILNDALDREGAPR